jgi:predicted transcriptional regulator
MADHVTVPVQTDLKNALVTYAKEHDMSAATVARQAIAQFLGVKIVELPTRSRQKRYASAEERRDAQKTQQKSQRTMVKAAMLAARAGDTDISIKLLTNQMTLEEAEAYMQSKSGVSTADEVEQAEDAAAIA